MTFICLESDRERRMGESLGEGARVQIPKNT